MDIAYQIAIWLVPLVVAIVLHEVAHGWTARAFGDRTASRLGRLSLNPLRHVDPVGTVILPLALAVAHAPIFGWAKPVPVDREGMRNPRWNMVAVALAGPGMNLALALLTAVVLGLVSRGIGTEPAGMAKFVTDLLVNFLLVNVFLALFNLLPVPPFDGGHVVEGLLPRPFAAHWARLARFALPIMIVLLVVLPMLSPGASIVARLVAPPAEAAVRFFLGIADAIA